MWQSPGTCPNDFWAVTSAGPSLSLLPACGLKCWLPRGRGVAQGREAVCVPGGFTERSLPPSWDPCSGLEDLDRGDTDSFGVTDT